MVRFTEAWLTIVIVFWVLSIAWAIFSPVLNSTLSPLVDDAIYDGQTHSGANGDQSAYYASLYSAKTLILLMFNWFPFCMSTLLAMYGILVPLKKEQSDYPM